MFRGHSNLQILKFKISSKTPREVISDSEVQKVSSQNFHGNPEETGRVCHSKFPPERKAPAEAFDEALCKQIPVEVFHLKFSFEIRKAIHFVLEFLFESRSEGELVL